MLDLTTCPIDLTAALVDIESPSHFENAIADEVEQALSTLRDRLAGTCPITVDRHGNTIVARTHRGLGSRVILAGHIDTVPIADNVPSSRGLDSQGRDTLFGCGTVDMKSGMAVYLHAFATLVADPALAHDLTVVAYEGEEVASVYNGLRMVAEAHPDWLEGDVALLGRRSSRVIGTPVWHYRLINVAEGAMWVFGWDRPRGLADVRCALMEEGYAIPEPDHTAEGDVRTTRAVYEALRAIRSGMGA